MLSWAGEGRQESDFCSVLPYDMATVTCSCICRHTYPGSCLCRHDSRAEMVISPGDNHPFPAYRLGFSRFSFLVPIHNDPHQGARSVHLFRASASDGESHCWCGSFAAC